jgi:uncharacterized membrane protein YgcG
MQASLPEELLLLALHDEKGSVIPSAASVLNGALVGAVLMELGLAGRLREDADGRLLADPTPTGNQILDEALLRIDDADRPRMASYWVGRLARQMPGLKDRLLEQLVARGVLERRERRILWVFPSRSYPLVDAAAEQQVRDRVRAAILEDRTPDQRTAALIGLVRACNLIDDLFAPHERTRAHRRFEELTSEAAVTQGALGAGLESVLMGALLGATILYAHQTLNRPDDYDSDWSFGDSSTWDTNWGEAASASDSGGWDSGGPGGDSGSADFGGGDSGGGGGD